MVRCDLNHNRNKWNDTGLLRTDPGVTTNRSSSVKHNHVFIWNNYIFRSTKTIICPSLQETLKYGTIQSKLLVCTVFYLVWRCSFLDRNIEIFLNKKHCNVWQNYCDYFEVHKHSGISSVKIKPTGVMILWHIRCVTSC